MSAVLTREAASEAEQERIGASLAAVCPERCVLFLEGDLGAGKTTLVRGFLRMLGQRGPVRSPTYTLVEPYEPSGRRCFHLDLYRLSDPSELEYLGIRDLLEGPAILLVEWPERGRAGLPEPDLLIRIEPLVQGRRLRLRGCTERGRVMLRRLDIAGPGYPPVRN